MRAYSEAYLNDVVENQGKLFDYVAQSFPDMDTEDFINTYMRSKTRISIDKAKAYKYNGRKGTVELFYRNRRVYAETGKSNGRFCPRLDWRILCLLSVVF